MKFLIRFILIVCIVVLAGLFYSWTNLWVRSDTIGILYVSGQETPILISPNPLQFDWHWKRLIPNRTTLIKISTETQQSNTPLVFHLPNAQYYSALADTPIRSFQIDLFVKVYFSITSDTLIPYLTDEFPDATARNNTNIASSLRAQIQKQMVSFAPTLLEKETTWTMETLREELRSIFHTHTQAISSLYPLHIYDISFEIISLPDLQMYNYLVNTTSTERQSIVESTSASPLSKSRSQFLSQYLLFIREVGKILKENPETLEVIRLLPPQAIRDATPSNTDTEDTE